MLDLTVEDLKAIHHVTSGFRSMGDVNSKIEDEIERLEEVAALDFDDCESCKL